MKNLCDYRCIHVHLCIFRGMKNNKQLEGAKMTDFFSNVRDHIGTPIVTESERVKLAS